VRIAVVGGGPGGLYFSYFWKKRHRKTHIDLFEQNPATATWGFGVVFSEQALEFLSADDPDTVAAIAPSMESWKNITLNLRGESVEIDGVGFSSIGRLELLKLLQARAASVGVTLRYDTPIGSIDLLAGYDLIVAADGLNSQVRRAFEGDFGTSLSYSSNKFAWYGTTKRFETLSQTFVKNELGIFNAQLQTLVSHEQSTLSVAAFLGLVLALWSARSAMSALMTATNIAYGEREKRNFFIQVLISLVLTTGAIVGFLAMLLLGSLLFGLGMWRFCRQLE